MKIIQEFLDSMIKQKMEAFSENVFILALCNAYSRNLKYINKSVMIRYCIWKLHKGFCSLGGLQTLNTLYRYLPLQLLD